MSTLIIAVADPKRATLLLVLSGLMAGVAFIIALIAWRVGPIALCAFGVLVTAIVVPGSMRACCGGNESSAISALRAINSAQGIYAAICAHGGFAIDIADLARVPSRGEAFAPWGWKVNGVINSGYIITLSKDATSHVTDVGSPAETCNDSVGQPVSSYFASANPVQVGVTGARYFATDRSGTIVSSTKGPVPNPIQLGPDVQLLQ